DAGFHAYQMLEAGVRQFTVWGNTDEGRHILIAVARYLAAHSPTESAGLQTAHIAPRLMRGGELHQEAPASWRRAPRGGRGEGSFLSARGGDWRSVIRRSIKQGGGHCSG